MHGGGAVATMAVPQLPAMPAAPEGEIENPWADGRAQNPFDAFLNPFNPTREPGPWERWERAAPAKREAWERARTWKRDEFDRIVAEMRAGQTFSSIYRSAIVQYVDSWWQALKLEELIEEKGMTLVRKSGEFKRPEVDTLYKIKGQINKWLNDFGLTSAGRRRAFMETQKGVGPSLHEMLNEDDA